MGSHCSPSLLGAWVLCPLLPAAFPHPPPPFPHQCPGALWDECDGLVPVLFHREGRWASYWFSVTFSYSEIQPPRVLNPPVECVSLPTKDGNEAVEPRPDPAVRPPGQPQHCDPTESPQVTICSLLGRDSTVPSPPGLRARGVGPSSTSRGVRTTTDAFRGLGELAREGKLESCLPGSQARGWGQQSTSPFPWQLPSSAWRPLSG